MSPREASGQEINTNPGPKLVRGGGPHPAEMTVKPPWQDTPSTHRIQKYVTCNTKELLTCNTLKLKVIPVPLKLPLVLFLYLPHLEEIALSNIMLTIPWLFFTVLIQMYLSLRASLIAQMVKNLPEMKETRVRKIPWRRKWQPTPVFLPGKSHGQRSLVGYSPWGCRVRYN